MKTTIVPAQITTVEDKVAGSLSFSQLILLIAPIFLSGAIYAFFPPFISFSLIKTAIVIILTATCLTLAIRIKGRLVMEWLVIRSRYNKRPTFYTSNKNDIYLRSPVADTKEKSVNESTAYVFEQKTSKRLAIPKLVRIENMVTDPKSDFHFKTNKKGGLSVHIKEIK